MKRENKFEILSPSQFEHLWAICKEKTLNTELTQYLMDVVRNEYQTNIKIIDAATLAVKDFTLENWGVDTVFLLDVDKYAEENDIKLKQDIYIENNAYYQTQKLINLICSKNDLKNYMLLIKLAWANTQREVNKYWSFQEVEMTAAQLKMGEDAKIQVLAYNIVNSRAASQLYCVLKCVEYFSNFELYEEALPVSCLETAFQLIVLEACQQKKELV